MRVLATDRDGVTEYELPGIHPTIFHGDQVTTYWQNGADWHDEDTEHAVALLNHTSDRLTPRTRVPGAAAARRRSAAARQRRRRRSRRPRTG